MNKVFLTDEDSMLLDDVTKWMPSKTIERLADNNFEALDEIIERLQTGEEIFVAFAFDEDKLSDYGYWTEDVVELLKETFSNDGIQCAYEDLLSFICGESENDLENIWNIIMTLCNTEWFLECVTSCVLYRNGHGEDVLEILRENP